SLDIPGRIIEQTGRSHGNQQLREQVSRLPVRRKMPATQQHRAVERFLCEVDVIDVHPGAGQLHLVADLQMTKPAEPRQQPAHGQRRRRLHAQDSLHGRPRSAAGCDRFGETGDRRNVLPAFGCAD
nr:hypothetical protein [Tanacetum cinerariifolium]